MGFVKEQKWVFVSLAINLGIVTLGFPIRDLRNFVTGISTGVAYMTVLELMRRMSITIERR